MSFAVYNKLDKPIYIDWKNSSFIYNDNKLNYWVDETQTKSAAYYGGYFYTGPLLKSGYTINQGVQSSVSSTVKPERETFIPPHSNYYRSQFYLLPISYYQLKLDCQKDVVPCSSIPENKATICKEEFSLNNSPLHFRNYLAFSLSDNSSQFFFVDNEFYLSSVKEMDTRYYLGDIVGTNNGEPIYKNGAKNEFEKGTSFYIRMPSNTGVEHSLFLMRIRR